ncbi:MAG: amino acid ABC transporter permease [Terrisporobacter othiniensis]|uniref:amino acid ABC transporter permease n=1 Tax=Terrisporobacter petrolearius TaxID=1460447 RepID=UPI0008E6D244|nr:amino acid ABC transporter permease [Terrisporobacter petrolearius]MDU4859419.1 amino acid ABC transporter permease [Terrisporobacter othiniensis]MDU6993806.1 amino acid ABC transporter permease [Terrisporobacter othiniensis]SFI99842.1 polar amino acid transport system permease protein [Terrisporobacter glycolicus]
MLEGLKITLSVFFITLIISAPLGIMIAFLRLSKNKIISQMANLYILIMRGTPLLLQLVFVFFGLPLMGIIFDRFDAVILAFSLNYAAYFAEIFRGGIQSIDKGQYEGAFVLGFSKFEMYRKIIFPQVIKRVLPAMSNEVITLIKDTAIVYAIGLNDILRIAQISQNQQASIVPLIEAGAVYLVLIGILTIMFKKIENKYAYYR